VRVTVLVFMLIVRGELLVARRRMGHQAEP
jgi:hypothetical protein